MISQADHQNAIEANLDRSLIIEIIRVSESAAIAAAKMRGKLNDIAADKAAIEAMHRELDLVHIDGNVVIGESPGKQKSKLRIGDKVGSGKGPECEVAVEPLEGTTICAKDLQNAMSVVAIAKPGSLLAVPEIYMEKIAIGPGYDADVVSLSKPPSENLKSLAKAKGTDVSNLTVCILDRQRHGRLISEVLETGASIRLISDGDLAGVINTTNPDESGIDIYLGIGGAREGVLAACALSCMGGQMQGRLVLDNQEKRIEAEKLGIEQPDRIFNLNEMAHGDIMFAATGVTDGDLLGGVEFGNKEVLNPFNRHEIDIKDGSAFIH